MKYFPKLLLSMCAVYVAGCGPKNPLELEGMLVAVREVRNAMTSVATQVDVATANRITQIDVVAGKNIAKIEEVIAKGANATAVQREEAARQAFSMLADAQRVVDSSGKNVFGRVNESLAGASSVVAGLPFSNMQETVFALEPLKITRALGDRQASVYGYLPTFSEAPERASITVDGVPVKFDRGVGKVTFNLPPVADQRLFSTVQITIRKPWWRIFAPDPTPLTVRIRYVNEAPFRFFISADKDNPGAFVNVTGIPHHSTANSANVSKTPVFAAATLFRLTVADLEKYEPDTATLIGVVKDPASGGGKPCTACDEPTGDITAWGKESVQLALSAPNCPRKIIKPSGFFEAPYVCNGGGSNYNMLIVPTFNVRVKGAPDTVPVWQEQTTMRHRSVSELSPPTTWTSILVKMKYDDAIDQFEEVVFLKKGAPVGTAAGFDANVSERSLVIRTR